MTQEEAAELWPRIKQWSEGAEMQLKDGGAWKTVQGGCRLGFFLGPDYYRIKPGSRKVRLSKTHRKRVLSI